MNFSWIWRWIIPLMVVCVFLIICYHAIPALGLTNFWYHYSGACAMALGFYWYWGMYIKGPDFGIQFIDNWFRRLPEKADISNHIQDTSLVLYYSKRKHLWGMIAWFGTGLFALYYIGYKHESFFWGFFLGCLCLRAALSFRKGFLDSSPQLILREDGLATPRLGFVSWESITIIQLRDSSSEETKSTDLDIYVSQEKSPHDTVRADLLGIGKDELRISIAQFAKREVPFV